MFKCQVCVKEFSRKDNLTRHMKRHMTSESVIFSCDLCKKSFSRNDNLKRHIVNHNGKGSVSNSMASTSNHVPSTSDPTISNPMPSTSGAQYSVNNKKCLQCQIDVPIFKFSAHLRTNTHKANCCKSFNSNVELIEHAFKCRIASYKIKNTNEKLLNPIEFLQFIKNIVLPLLSDQLNIHNTIKCHLELFSLYSIPTTNEVDIKSFITKNQVITKSSNINTIYDEMCSMINNKVQEFQERKSGWSLLNILHLEVNINKYNPLRGSSFIELPKNIEKKHACVNIVNHDNKCFAWSIVSALRPATQHINRVSSYPHFSEILNFSGVEFPVKLIDVHKIELLNNISINIFGLEFNHKLRVHEVIGPLHYTKTKKDVHINLLYVEDGERSHYCWIKDLSKLIGYQLSKTQHRKWICDGCLLFFNSENGLLSHQNNCNKIKTDLPSQGDIIEFKNHYKQFKVPFVVYADFESILRPISTCIPNPQNSSTTTIQRHEPCSFGYYIKCEYNQSLSKYVSYRNPDCVETFVKNLRSDVKTIYHTYLKPIVAMLPLTVEEKEHYLYSKKCHICNKDLDLYDKVPDHCHLTGKFRGSAHNSCNLNLKVPNFIPIFFHNLSGYDSHLFISELAKYFNDEVNVIPNNKEKYVSFSQKIFVDKINSKSVFIEMRFLDSFRFMSTSIDNLSAGLNSTQFIELRKIFNDNHINLITRKGVFPYDFIDTWEKFGNESLPSIECFFSKVQNKNIRISEYEHAQNVWTNFKIRNLGEYSDFYLKTDVLLLTDIFENFRSICMGIYNLDPCHYYTAPGLSWDAMLKLTQIKIEQLCDIDMVNFFKMGIRGGISQCSNRYGKANNKYIDGYDESKDSNYLIYLDANNLYGWAMSKYLPYGGFRWMDETEIKKFNPYNVTDNDNIGYVLEVDLEYPSSLHDVHNDLPFCAENISPPNNSQSKLIPNLKSKTKYIINCLNLKQCMKAGLRLKSINRILQFNQAPWLKSYIDLNTTKRQQAKNDFEKDFFKLMNNSIYGKTMENVDKRVDVRLVNRWKNIGKRLGAEKLIAKPNFHSSTIFNENFVAIQMNRIKVCYDKPIFLGFTVLELSKNLMYDFHYNYIIQKYKNCAKLLYTDTDSLVYDIKTDDFYKDIQSDLNKFDTSNYPIDNRFHLPLVNNKVLGLMKDENAGSILLEFVGLRSKMYSMIVENKIIKKAKGVNKSVVDNFNFNDYLSKLNTNELLIKSMIRFKSIKHIVFTININKIVLSGQDDKRYLISNSTDTLAWGHYKINENYDD